MPDVTVTCHCSRIMRPDVLRGRGAYVCGCGIRVSVEVAIRPQCAGTADDEVSRCARRPVRESAQFGIALCRDHFDGYLEMLDLIRRGDKAGDLLMEAYQAEQAEWHATHQVPPEEAARLEQERRDRSVVYYVRIRDTIKIGYTANMEARMNDLVVDEVLAFEPGARELETARQGQFAHLKIRGERFRPGPDLLSHIEMIRQHFGVPVHRQRLGGPTTWVCEPA